MTCLFAQKEADPLLNARIRRVVDGTVCIGSVCDVHVGTISKERLYFIVYEDGDMEDMTELQVKETLLEAGTCTMDQTAKQASDILLKY